MSFERNPVLELPDGTISKTYPFHVSLEGLEKRILCREEDDYDAFVKIIHICARRKNVRVVIYAVVSNHAHAVILAVDKPASDAYGEDVKKMYAMYYARKYADKSVMAGIDAKPIWIDSDWYLRNAIAYDVRNAMDNGAASVQAYKWTGYRAMFCGGQPMPSGTFRKVSELTKREKRAIMHTDDDLTNVPWLLDEEGHLEPASTCEWRYLEAAFGHDQASFLRAIGSVNTAELGQKLVWGPRMFQPDSDFLPAVNDICKRWFNQEVHTLSVEKKARVMNYVVHSMKTNIAQLARTFELERKVVSRLLGRDH